MTNLKTLIKRLEQVEAKAKPRKIYISTFADLMIKASKDEQAWLAAQAAAEAGIDYEYEDEDVEIEYSPGIQKLLEKVQENIFEETFP